MKNLRLSSLLSLLLLLFFSSCKDEDRIETTAEKDFGQVSFNISDDKTKTIYDEENNLRINWKYGDVVKISCAQSTPTEGAYTVEKSSDPTKGTLKGDPTTSLKWNKGAGEHTFYGAYPYDKVIISGNEIKCQYNTNQMLSKIKNNNYAPINMKDGFMVAKTVSAPKSRISLAFKPVFTTLDIKIPVGTTSAAVTITSLSVTLNNGSKYISKTGEFTIDGSTLQDNIPLQPYTDADVNEKETITAKIGSVSVNPGDTAVFTLLLPPVDIEASTAIITAVIDGKTRTATIKERIEGGTRQTVKISGQLEKYPQELTIIPSTLYIPKGKDSTFIAVLKYSDESVDTLKTGLVWSSDAATVATVNQSTGLVKALESGKAEITATYEGVTGTAEVHVFEVGVEPNPLIIKEGDQSTHQLKIKITKADGTVEYPTSNATWDFTTSGIVSGNSTSTAINLKGVKRGATTAKVNYNGHYVSAKVYVAKPYYESSYYQWDAYESKEKEDKGVWQEGSSTHNTTNFDGEHGYITYVRATASCANAPTRDQAMMYIMAGYYYDKGEAEENIQPHASYTGDIPNKLSTKGVWIKKWNIVKDMALDPLPNYDLTGGAGVTKRFGGGEYRTYGRPPKSEINNYFFLPALSYYYKKTIPFWYHLSESECTASAWKMEVRDEELTITLYGGQNRDAGGIPLVGFDDTYIAITSIKSITVTTGSVIKGKTIGLKATATLEGGRTEDVTNRARWSSVHPTIATVNSSTGVVTGVAPGTATIKASLDGIEGSGTVTVTNKVTKLEIEGPDKVAVNKSITLTAYATREDGQREKVTPSSWTVVPPLNPNEAPTATVDSNGKVTGKIIGGAEIKAELEGISAKHVITVFVDNIKRMFIKCDGEEYSDGDEYSVRGILNVARKSDVASYIADQKILTAYFEYESGDIKQLEDNEVTWESSDEGLATVGTTGRLTGISLNGFNPDGGIRVTITANYSHYGRPDYRTASVDFFVCDNVESFTLNPGYIDGNPGENFIVAVTVTRRSGKVESYENLNLFGVVSSDPFVARYVRPAGYIVLGSRRGESATLTISKHSVERTLSVYIFKEGEM